MSNKIRIGLSKAAPNYMNWLRKIDDSVELVDLYPMSTEDARKEIAGVSGILFTGGSDIHPSRYNRYEDIECCKNIDEKRDELELLALEMSFRLKIPLLGICRGQQILNVARKGTLYADISKFCGDSVIHSDKEDVFHTVSISRDSFLFRISGVDSGTVNSAHHQAVKMAGTGLIPVAYSPDHIVEAMEADRQVDHPFCMAVQWHPERMDMEHPLSGKLGKAFLEAASRYR